MKSLQLLERRLFCNHLQFLNGSHRTEWEWMKTSCHFFGFFWTILMLLLFFTMICGGRSHVEFFRNAKMSLSFRHRKKTRSLNDGLMCPCRFHSLKREESVRQLAMQGSFQGEMGRGDGNLQPVNLDELGGFFSHGNDHKISLPLSFIFCTFDKSMIFQLSKGGTCWFCIRYGYVWLMFYGYITFMTCQKRQCTHLENPWVSFCPSRCPSAINANVTNGGPRRWLPVESGCWKLSDWASWVELSWVGNGLFLEAGNSKPLDVSSHPTKKGYLGALGDLQIDPHFSEKKTLQPEIVTLHSNVKIAVVYLPTFLQFPDVYRLDY